MTATRFAGVVLGLACLLAADRVHAADRAESANVSPSPDFSFFVAKNRDGSANLGGIVGADAQCQQMAESAGAGHRTWHAYLSATQGRSGRIVHARDRIGAGPWYNAKGVLIARDINELHSERHRIDRRTALDARGARPRRAPHDILTGSDPEGRLAFVGDEPATCANWTSAGAGVARIGHDDRMDAGSHDNKRFPRFNGSWNSEHDTVGCSAASLAETGGGGGFYCFAVEGGKEVPTTAHDTGQYTFAHGLNVNHWIGDNIASVNGGRAHLYGADWFDQEDVAWIAAHGYDHLRIQAAGNNWITASGEIDETAIVHFDRVLQWTKARGLGLVLAMHGLPGFRNGIRYGDSPTDIASPFTDAATRADAAYLWWLVARRYAHIGPQLRFELLTSPGAESADQIRLYNKDTLAAIREIDTERVVYLTSRSMRVNHVSDVTTNDPNTAISLRFFEPEVFARQFDSNAPQVKFPGVVPKELASEAYPAGTALTVNDLNKRVDELAKKAHAVAGAREVYIGVFGTLGNIDEESAGAYLRTVRDAFERNGLRWAVYDYHTGGAVRCCLEPEQLYETGDPTHIHRALFADRNGQTTL